MKKKISKPKLTAAKAKVNVEAEVSVRSCIDLTIKISPGTDLARAYKAALSLAKELGITIWFNFNGVECLARPTDNGKGFVKAYMTALKSDKQFKIASAH